jgi:hypothetical protein
VSAKDTVEVLAAARLLVRHADDLDDVVLLEIVHELAGLLKRASEAHAVRALHDQDA